MPTVRITNLPITLLMDITLITDITLLTDMTDAGTMGHGVTLAVAKESG